MSSTESILSKTFQTETGKYVLGKLFKRLDKLLEIRNKDHEITDALNAIRIPNDPVKRARLEEKIIDRYLKFKTINSDNVDVHIDDIYHPLQLSFCDNNTQNLVDDTFTLTNRKITCLIGKAGQGKTTLLRKLIQKELIDDNGKIPLLIILRDINWEKTYDVCEIVSLEFDRFGVSIPKEAVKYLLQFNKLFVCFDGYDEVKDEHRRIALTAINECFSKYDCQTVVTTRPGTQVTLSLDSSRNVTLLDLTLDDVYKIIDINKSIGEEYKEELKKAANSKDEIKSILLTPIIVDIFILVYGSMDAEPNTLTEFYGQLFSIIISKHDRFKYLTRQSESGLDNSKLHDVFCYACFKMILEKSSLDLKEGELMKVFADSCDRLGFKDHNNLSHMDIVNKTSLIKLDGNHYSFIHKTILEYHAARSIANLDSNLKDKFFLYLVEKYDTSFDNVLSFYKDIDTPSFYKYFVSRILSTSQIKSHYKFYDNDLLFVLYNHNVIQYNVSSSVGLTENAQFRLENLDVSDAYEYNLSMFKKLLEIIDYPIEQLKCYIERFISRVNIEIPTLIINDDVEYTKKKYEVKGTSISGSTTETFYSYNVKITDLMNYYVKSGQFSEEQLFCDDINILLRKLKDDVDNYIKSSDAQSALIDLLSKP
ncbi:NACHT domain-containing protein [Photobacterium leiognathi]|uniref:NACHT domain-containing protein n=1 Tax=Photobacterium leiognathi TaxID=553611 RepID=UPI00298116C7|nr:NACHT domain-containing protein [Photobacterium leiognathi]